MKKFALALALLPALVASAPTTYTIPATASMATILRFDKPADLFARPVVEHSDLEDAFGRPIVAFYFSDPAASEYSYELWIYPVGSALGKKRLEFERSLVDHQAKLSKAKASEIPFGVFQKAGRRVLCFPIGGGPGGQETAMLFPHLKYPIEVLVIESVNYREPPFQNSRRPDSRPTMSYYDAIPQIEEMITTK